MTKQQFKEAELILNEIKSTEDSIKILEISLSKDWVQRNAIINFYGYSHKGGEVIVPVQFARSVNTLIIDHYNDRLVELNLQLQRL